MKTLKFNLKLFYLLGAIFAFTYASSQPVNYMVLAKNGKGKRYYFYEGQEITYKLKNDMGFFTDRITKIKDSIIEFQTYSVSYNDIETVHIDKKQTIISNKAVGQYAISVGIATVLLQVAYLINTGAGMPTLGRDLLYVSSPIPVILLGNWVYSWFVKTEYDINPGEYQLKPVILRNDQ